MAVAIWTHLPTADELLQHRLKNGWQPVSSQNVDGPKIEGHAACTVVTSR